MSGFARKLLVLLVLTLTALWLPCAPAEANTAGCDGIGGHCSDWGKCCDDHDKDIGWACPPGCKSVLEAAEEACQDSGDDIWEGYDYEACHEAHATVTSCVLACRFGTKDCPKEPSECCTDDEPPEEEYCGCEQVCYDADKKEPIYDPCECKERELETDADCMCDDEGATEKDGYCDAFCPCGEGLTCEDNVCTDECDPEEGDGDGGGDGLEKELECVETLKSATSTAAGAGASAAVTVDDTDKPVCPTLPEEDGGEGDSGGDSGDTDTTRGL